MSERLDKVSKLIKKNAGDFISQQNNKTSLISITRVDVSKDLKNSNIYISVFPEKSEESALNFLKRKRKDFRDFFKANSKIRIVPFFDFVVDAGEKNRILVEEILRKK